MTISVRSSWGIHFNAWRRAHAFASLGFGLPLVATVFARTKAPLWSLPSSIYTSVLKNCCIKIDFKCIMHWFDPSWGDVVIMFECWSCCWLSGLGPWILLEIATHEKQKRLEEAFYSPIFSHSNASKCTPKWWWKFEDEYLCWLCSLHVCVDCIPEASSFLNFLDLITSKKYMPFIFQIIFTKTATRWTRYSVVAYVWEDKIFGCTKGSASFWENIEVPKRSLAFIHFQMIIAY